MEHMNPFSDRHRVLGDHADPLRSNPPIKSFSRPFTPRRSSRVTENYTASVWSTGSQSPLFSSRDSNGEVAVVSVPSKSWVDVWLTKKRVFCIYLPILCVIALIVGLVVAHVRESVKLSSEKDPVKPQTSRHQFTTTHRTLTTQIFVHPSTITHGSSKIITRVTSKIVRTFERTAVTETSIRLHVTTLDTASSSSKLVRSGTQSDSASTATSTTELAQSQPQSASTTSVSTKTLPTTSTIFLPPQESPKPGTTEVSQRTSKAVFPGSPNGGAQDPQVPNPTTARISLDTTASSPILSPVGSSVIIPVSSTFSETPNTETLGTSKVLVNPVSQLATTFSTATTTSPTAADGTPTKQSSTSATPDLTTSVSSTESQSQAWRTTTSKAKNRAALPKFLFRNESVVFEAANAAIASG